MKPHRLVLRRNLKHVTYFAPTVQVDGQTVTPTNWMWLLGYAVKGQQWAIDEVMRPAFLDKVRADPNISESNIQAVERYVRELPKRGEATTI